MLIQQLSVEPSLHLIDQFWLEKSVHTYKHPHKKLNKHKEKHHPSRKPTAADKKKKYLGHKKTSHKFRASHNLPFIQQVL
jgi:hypothetical protein